MLILYFPLTYSNLSSSLLSIILKIYTFLFGNCFIRCSDKATSIFVLSPLERSCEAEHHNTCYYFSKMCIPQCSLPMILLKKLPFYNNVTVFYNIKIIFKKFEFLSASSVPFLKVTKHLCLALFKGI